MCWTSEVIWSMTRSNTMTSFRTNSLCTPQNICGYWNERFYVSAAEHTDIKNDFVASRESLPAMFIVTPNDKKVSVWTKEAPSVQVCSTSILKFCYRFAICTAWINISDVVLSIDAPACRHVGGRESTCFRDWAQLQRTARHAGQFLYIPPV